MIISCDDETLLHSDDILILDYKTEPLLGMKCSQTSVLMCLSETKVYFEDKDEIFDDIDFFLSVSKCLEKTKHNNKLILPANINKFMCSQSLI